MDPTKQLRKRRDPTKLQSVYERALLTRTVVLSINVVGKNLDEVFAEYIRDNFEGKCAVDGFIKPNSSKIISYSCGVIQRGNSVSFEVIFECQVCYPVEGMIISCVAKNIVKAGIKAESATEVPSPFIVFIAKDHHAESQQFLDVKEGDKINVKVIGQRFELNDKFIGVIGELMKERETRPKPQTAKPRLIIEG